MINSQFCSSDLFLYFLELFRWALRPLYGLYIYDAIEHTTPQENARVLVYQLRERDLNSDSCVHAA
jgi:hypothetical protein